MNKRFQGGGRRWAPWVAVLLCWSAEARAQAPEPPPVVAPPELPPTPPASAPAPPPTTPPATAPEPPIVPPAVTAAPPPNASPTAPAAVKPPLSWAGTTFDWGIQLSTKSFGIGPDYIGSDDEQASMTWSLTPSYFVFWRPRHQLSVGTRITVLVELTDSNTTTRKQEPEISDIPLGLDYAATLFTRGHGRTIGGVRTMRDPTLLGEGDWRTWALVSTYLILPASPTSRAAGLDLGTSVGVGLRQQLKLLGGDSVWLSYLLVTASERWTHAFTSAPATPFGGSFPSAYQGSSIVPNTLSHTLSLTVPIHRDLQLDTTFQLRNGFPASVGGDGSGCVQLPTGCVSPSPVAPSVVRTSTRFALGLSYEIIPELGIGLGYVNDDSQLGDDGTKRSLFYSPNAQFYTDVTFSFDRLYQRLSAPAPAPAGPAI